MPLLKAINGHTGCGNVQRYLEKNDRAIGHDYYNLSWDEREMPDADDMEKPAIQWAAEMDQLRELHDNDRAYGSRKAITYRHYILSPSPEDDISLEDLRSLTRAWVEGHFADYQVAIVYHDDNARGIPHAHIVVNNTNMQTGKRLHISNPKQLNRDLQDMAAERDLVRFDNGNRPPMVKAKILSHRAHSSQYRYRSSAERAIERDGGYSWVADIRSRAEVAFGLSANTAEYKKVLEALGVNIADNSRNARRDDWIYSLAEAPSRKVSGGKLGYRFTKDYVRGHFNGGSFEGSTKRDILKFAKSAIELGSLQELYELADCMNLLKWGKITSVSDLDRKMASIEKRNEALLAGPSKKLAADIEQLKHAKEFCTSYGVLPEKPPAHIVEARRQKAERAKAYARSNGDRNWSNEESSSRSHSQSHSEQSRGGWSR